MNTIEFLTAFWPTEGIYVIETGPHPVRNVPGEVTHYRYAFDTVEEAAAEVVRQRGKHNVYFGCHSYAKYHQVEVNGRVRDKVRRTAVNTAFTRIFYFDLDVLKPGELDPKGLKYATVQDAMADLLRFVGEAGLPMPSAVKSGFGLHCYYRLAENMPSSQWMPLARRFKQLLDHHALRADRAATADAARVLRPAGSFNHKRGTPVLVKLLGPLQPAMPIAVWIGALEAACRHLPDPNEFRPDGGGFKPEDPASAKALLKVCPTFVKMTSEVRTQPEPEWRAMLQVVRHCKGGEKIAHQLSSLHPEYSPEGTQAKLDRLTAMDQAPLTCGYLQELYGSESPCPTCPNFGLYNSSPIVFARRLPAVELPPEIPPPERPYMRTKRGVEFQELPKGDDEEPPKPPIILYGHDLYPVRIVSDELNKTRQVEWKAEVPHRGSVLITLPITAYTDPKKMVAMMADQGVYVDLKHANHMGGYVSHYIKTLQAAQNEAVKSETFGYQDDFKTFLIGDRAYSAGGVKTVPVSSRMQNAAQGMTVGGTLESQIKAVRFYRDPRYIAQQFVILCALGSPLFHMTGHHGLLVNVCGKSGASKTTALTAAGGLWGRPVKYLLNGTALGATPLARLARMEVLGNLPVLLDEVTDMPDDAIKSFALAITQGGPRARLFQNGEERPIPDNVKSTLLISTSNNSMHARLSVQNQAGTAGSMRVIELLVEALNVHTKGEADAALRELNTHFGHIGPAFINFLLSNPEAVEAELRATIAEIDRVGHIRADERYWATGFSIAVCTARIAKRLGLLDFDPAEVLRWAVEVQLPLMRGVVRDHYMSPVETLQAFLGDIGPNLLTVSAEKGSNRFYAARDITREVYGRYEIESRQLWVSKISLRRYCEKYKINFDPIAQELMHKGIVGQCRMTLTRGVDNYAGTQMPCFKIDMNHVELVGTRPIEDGRATVVAFPAPANKVVAQT